MNSKHRLQDVHPDHQVHHITPTDINSPLHHHTLYRTDVRSVYPQSNGEWSCYVCRKNNGPGHFYPAHCSQCKFDFCDNCIKPYKSTFHPEHAMYKADSNVTYSRFNGLWYCDKCSRRFTPQTNNVPYHCSQCEVDLCNSCMTTADDVTTAGKNTSGDRGGWYAPYTKDGNPIAPPSDDVDKKTGLPGVPGISPALQKKFAPS